MSAFTEGDREPLFAASEKSWVKSAEADARKTEKVFGKAPTNRATVIRERRRTNSTSSVVRYRSGGAQSPETDSPNKLPLPTPANGTSGAGAPVAPPPCAAGR